MADLGQWSLTQREVLTGDVDTSHQPPATRHRPRPPTRSGQQHQRPLRPISDHGGTDSGLAARPGSQTRPGRGCRHTPIAGKTDLRSQGCCRGAARPSHPVSHRGDTYRTPQGVVGRGGSQGRHPSRPRRRWSPQPPQRVRRCRGDLRLSGAQDASLRVAGGQIQDFGDPGRGPPRWRCPSVGVTQSEALSSTPPAGRA